jgi:tetratricopeptide (TPR) repeat protein
MSNEADSDCRSINRRTGVARMGRRGRRFKSGTRGSKQKKYDEALKLFTNAIESKELKEKRLADAYYFRGNSYRAKNLMDKAVDDYTKAIKINPTFGGAYNNRGAIYKNKGELDKAIAVSTMP